MASSDIRAITEELLAELESVPTVDAHEHLPTEEAHIAGPADFYSLFEHYCRADLVAAGAADTDLALWANREEPLDKRWRSFKPYYDAIKTTGYTRAARISMDRLLGVEELDDDSYEAVGAALSDLRKPGLYDKVIRETCNISACIQCWRLGDPGPDYFYHLAPGPLLMDLHTQGAVDTLSKTFDVAIHTLDDVLTCLDKAIAGWRLNPKVVGIKSAHAYSRSLRFRKTDRHTAERVFNSILTNEAHTLSIHQALPLQDYLLFQTAARAEASGLPIVIHTGLQAGNFNRIENANPLLLQSFLEEFPRLKVDLFHAGMPYVREIAVLARYFPGVHLNMAWSHIIDPAMARSALSEWIDMVPNTKIFGFGGDYSIVEKIVGHLSIARHNIARVLAEKVVEADMTRSEASVLVRRLMHDNPAAFYGLAE